MSSYHGSQSAEHPHSPSSALQPGRPWSWTWKQLHIFFFRRRVFPAYISFLGGMPQHFQATRLDLHGWNGGAHWLIFLHRKTAQRCVVCSLKSEICLFNQTCRPWAESCFSSAFTTTRAHKHTTTAVRCVCRRPLFARLDCRAENKWQVMKLKKKQTWNGISLSFSTTVNRGKLIDEPASCWSVYLSMRRHGWWL